MDNFKVAYMCTGLDPKCSGKPGCFKCLRPYPLPDLVCMHTTDIRYAVHEPCEDPENYVPSRFKKFVVGDEIRYFEDYT